MIPLIRNNGNNNIVAMVSNTDSFLAKNSLYVLKAKVEKEACPLNLAPTNSTTAQVSAGRCISNVFGRVSQFLKQGFCEIPSGRKFRKTFVHAGFGCLRWNESALYHERSGNSLVILAMSKGRLGAVAIVDEEERLEGIITDGDLRRMMEKYDDVDG